MNKRLFIICLICIAFCTQAILADSNDSWLQRWNRESGRKVKLKKNEVLFKESQSSNLAGLTSAGFRQSDGTYVLGKIIWKQESFSPLGGYTKILQDLGFAEMNDSDRREIFLELLQQTHGLLGTRPYTGPSQRKANRPRPLTDLRNLDDSHRFQVWFFRLPVKAESGEWREVLYFVDRNTERVQAKTLGSYRPQAEKLRDFPAIDSSLFE